MPRVQHDPLTDAQLRALAPGPTPIDVRDGELRGLVVTVLPSGRKQFNVRYRHQGKQRRLMLGEYPGVSLAKARKLARREQAAIDSGRDPARERRAAKAKRTDTVESLVTEYLAKHARRFKRSADEDARILEVEVLPRWRDRSVREVTRHDVQVLVERKAEAAPIMANRVLAVVRKMLNFAVDKDWIDANPAARVKKPSPENSRDRVLTEDEVRRLWRLLSREPTTEERPAPGRKRSAGAPDDPICPVSAPMAALLKVRLLTAQRGGEVGRMRWQDLELPKDDDKRTGGWWNIPGEHTKNGKPHRVPMTAEVVGLVKAQAPDTGVDRVEHVFVGRGGAAVLDRAKKAPSAVARALGIDFRGHDLRRTAATHMAAAGVPREHIARVLNHVEGGPRATKIYDRYAYGNEKQIALESWARRLNEILTHAPTSNVVPFAKS